MGGSWWPSEGGLFSGVLGLILGFHKPSLEIDPDKIYSHVHCTEEDLREPTECGVGVPAHKKEVGRVAVRRHQGPRTGLFPC